MRGATLLLASALAMVGGCVEPQVAYPIEAPTWEPGDWWQYEQDGRRTTLTVAGTAGGHALLVRQAGDDVDLVAVRPATLTSEGPWRVEPGTGTLAEVVPSEAFPMVRFPLRPDSNWSTEDSSWFIVGVLDTTTKAQVTGDAVDEVGRRDLAAAVVETTMSEVGVVLFVPIIDRERMAVHYSPAAEAPTWMRVGGGFPSGVYGWATGANDGKAARLVAFGHGEAPAVDPLLWKDLQDAEASDDALPDIAGAGYGVTHLAWTGPQPCGTATSRLWDTEGRLVADVALVARVQPEGCEWGAALPEGRFAGHWTLERWDGGAIVGRDEATVRLGEPDTVSAPCPSAPGMPCGLWSGAVGPGEQVWAELFLPADVDHPLGQTAVLMSGGQVLERQPFRSLERLLFETPGDGSVLTLGVELAGASLVRGQVAVLPPVPPGVS